MDLTLDAQIHTAHLYHKRPSPVADTRSTRKKVRMLLSLVKGIRKLRLKSALRNKTQFNHAFTPKESAIMLQVRDLMSVDMFDTMLSEAGKYLPKRRAQASSGRG